VPTRLLHPIRNWQQMTVAEQTQIRNLLLVLIPVMVLTVFTVGMFKLSLTQPLRVAAPFVFSALSYKPHGDGVVCPGEVLSWPVQFTIQRAPVMVISVRSIWDVDDNQTATLRPGEIIPGSLQFTNYTETTEVSRTAEMMIPTLPPGEYQVRSAAQEFNSQAAAYAVPFTVEDGCPPLPETTP
jgi:hypothetical protein